jgi:hypothetical protein
MTVVPLGELFEIVELRVKFLTLSRELVELGYDYLDGGSLTV